MLAYILHQALDHRQAHREGHHAAYHQHRPLCHGGESALQEIFQQLQGAGTQHGGDGQEEGEFRRRRPGHADEDRAQDGGAGAGCTGNQAQALERADEQGGAVVNVVNVLHPGRQAPVLSFDEDEGDAVDDQGHGYYHIIIEVSVHPVVQQQADHCRGDHRHDDLEPQVPGLLLLNLALFRGEGVELVEEKYDHRQNRAELDHHLEHFVEGIGYVQLYKFIQKDQVARRGDGQPFRDALHDAKQDRFQNFDHR